MGKVQPPKTLTEQIGVTQGNSDLEFTSTHLPSHVGNSLKIGYGGGTAGVAVHAAFKTVPESMKVYSVAGYFLGPTFTDFPLYCQVHPVRDTKTFATRRVLVTQKLADGKVRSCMELIADFQQKEPASVYEYSVKPRRNYKPPTEIPTFAEMADNFVQSGKVSAQRVAQMMPGFAVMAKFVDTRHCPEGVSGQNMMGYAKTAATDQDSLPMTEKFMAEWVQTIQKLTTPGDRLAALVFYMDAGLSFTPLVFDHKFLDDVGACSTLDFTLRVFADDIDLSEWHVRERMTIAASEGRTYSEGKLFDASGRLVAIESQQSIMRPLPPKKSVL